MTRTVVSLFDRTGNMVRPWLEAGYRAVTVDLAGAEPEAEGYAKRTCLWVGGGFLPPAKRRVEPTLGSLIVKIPERASRIDEREATPLGFAYAVFRSIAGGRG